MANFWANQGAAAKRKYRFKLRIGMSGVGGIDTKPTFEEWVVTKVTRPSFSISDTTHSYLNHTFKFPGRLTWEDVSFTVVEPYKTDSTDALLSMLYESGYRLPKVDERRTIAKQDAVIDIFEIEALDNEGNKADKWTLKNPWISQANFGEFDYTADDLMSIDVTVKYDFAFYKTETGAKAQQRYEKV